MRTEVGKDVQSQASWMMNRRRKILKFDAIAKMKMKDEMFSLPKIELISNKPVRW